MLEFSQELIAIVYCVQILPYSSSSRHEEREISVQILHLSFLSVHCLQRRKKDVNFLIYATCNNTRKESLTHFDIIGALSGQAARQKSMLEQFILILSHPIISNRLSPNSCQRDVFVLIYMKLCILYHKLHHSLLCPKANRRLKYQG